MVFFYFFKSYIYIHTCIRYNKNTQKIQSPLHLKSYTQTLRLLKNYFILPIITRDQSIFFKRYYLQTSFIFSSNSANALEPFFFFSSCSFTSSLKKQNVKMFSSNSNQRWILTNNTTKFHKQIFLARLVNLLSSVDTFQISVFTSF